MSSKENFRDEFINQVKGKWVNFRFNKNGCNKLKIKALVDKKGISGLSKILQSNNFLIGKKNDKLGNKPINTSSSWSYKGSGNIHKPTKGDKIEFEFTSKNYKNKTQLVQVYGKKGWVCNKSSWKPGAPNSEDFISKKYDSFIICKKTDKYICDKMLAGDKVNNKNNKNDNKNKIKNKPKSLKNKKGDKVILFYADWCGYCQQLMPIWNKVKKNLKDKVNFEEYNHEAKFDTKKYTILGYPTIMVEKGGKLTLFSDMRTEEKLTSFIKDNLL